MDADASRPRQNRVDPFGEIVSVAARGTLMGNRGGCLHDEGGRLGLARWRSRRWIACLLAFKGRQRQVMAPGRYTELFFLDEATALAAGHRPCAECRREDFNRFKSAWLRGNPEHNVSPSASIDEIDKQLQSERVGRNRQKVTFRAAVDSLPDGTIIGGDSDRLAAQLVWQGNLYRWSFTGYAAPEKLRHDHQVDVLTPRSIVRAFAAGYQPSVGL